MILIVKKISGDKNLVGHTDFHQTQLAVMTSLDSLVLTWNYKAKGKIVKFYKKRSSFLKILL